MKAIETFNTIWLFHTPYTFRERYEWIFKDDWLRIYNYHGSDDFGIFCKSHTNYIIEYQYNNNGDQVISTNIYQTSDDNSWDTRGRNEFIRFSDTMKIEVHKLRFCYSPGGEIQTILPGDPYIYYDERTYGTYTGQACYAGLNLVIPHGDGRWVLKDGRVIEGEGVAWKGEPRIPLLESSL